MALFGWGWGFFFHEDLTTQSSPSKHSNSIQEEKEVRSSASADPLDLHRNTAYDLFPGEAVETPEAGFEFVAIPFVVLAMKEGPDWWRGIGKKNLDFLWSAGSVRTD